MLGNQSEVLAWHRTTREVGCQLPSKTRAFLASGYFRLGSIDQYFSTAGELARGRHTERDVVEIVGGSDRSREDALALLVLWGGCALCRADPNSSGQCVPRVKVRMPTPVANRLTPRFWRCCIRSTIAQSWSFHAT
jgi:hypothetical protein